MAIALSLEQQFQLRAFQESVRRMSHGQSQEFCLRLFEENLVMKATYDRMIGKKWGVLPTGDRTVTRVIDDCVEGD